MARRGPKPRAITTDLLLDRAIPEPNSGCLLWLFGTTRDGYGHMWADGKHVYAHRAMYELTTGEQIRPGLSVLHRCDTPSCINPEHLFAGTQRDNMQDAAAKKRLRQQKITFIPPTPRPLMATDHSEIL